MNTINYNDTKYYREDNETVLDCLLRNTIEIPYACKTGVCHVCMMHCSKGDVGINATEGLSFSQLENGHFLSCQSTPNQDITIKNIDESGLFTQSLVVDKSILSDTVCSIKIKPATQIYYHAGQFINIKMNDNHVRSYSIANLPSEGQNIELHIKKMENGLFSNYLYNEIEIGSILDIQGPFGNCYYPSKQSENNILMIATGTGIAPLVAILKDALNENHQGQISLYHGDRTLNDLYAQEQIVKLTKQYKNVRYYPATSIENLSRDGIYHGRITDLAFQNHLDLKDHLIFLCGSPEMVTFAESTALSRTADASMIYSDPFVTKDLRIKVR